MSRNAARCFVFLVTGLTLASPLSVRADDSAASIAAGGLVPRRETRIVMAKEVLRIGEKKVVVDYDFRNDTGQDVTTEVAFPIPAYGNDFIDGPTPEEQSFQSFKLWVDGKPVRYQSEATATLKDRDVTGLLKANRIDIPSFGHYEDKVDTQHMEAIDAAGFSRLPQAAKDRLVKAGVFNLAQGPLGQWTVHLQYHWTQSFPAHSTVHIQHEYAPVVGFTQVSLGAVDDTLEKLNTGRASAGDQDEVKSLEEFCADRTFLTALGRQLKENSSQAKKGEKFTAGIAYPRWVDFILTSANTWKRPIEDFTLIVDRPGSELSGRVLITFCSPANGRVEKLDADHFQVHLTNFVPTSELHIGYFDVPAAKPTQPAEKK